MKHRYSLFKVMVALVCMIVLNACTQTPGNSSTTTPIAGHQITPTTSYLSPSPSVLPTKTPAPPPQAPAPQDCPPGPAPQVLFPALGAVIGGGKVWFNGMDGPHAIIHFSSDGYTFPYGWTRKLVWEVGPLPVSQVTLQGSNLSTHQALWFQIGEQEPSQAPVLDPQHPGHPGSAVGANWAEWGSYLFVPEAGCYMLEASWVGGHWQIFFAAGH